MRSFVSDLELETMREQSRRVFDLSHGRTFFIDTYGCQQNEADSEQMRGMLLDMGFSDAPKEEADLIVLNTCAVRENAENRAFGNLGHLTHWKRENPSRLLIFAGCMAGDRKAAERVLSTFRHVDALLDTTSIWRLPEVVLSLLDGTFTGSSAALPKQPDARIAEGLPKSRSFPHKAWVSVMYGCDNFCSYCIVPHVRGRERSRKSADILSEIRSLTENGCKDITLLGQNVNSYGKTLEGEPDFAGLLEQINKLPGDFLVRFMTSHPKDAGERLFDVMADCEKIAPALHLPVQSGSDRILQRMNRGYTAEEYFALIDYAREKMPELTVTSDIIVGFPGETEEDFADTLELVRRVGYDSLFTFIFSKRNGTPAAELSDDTPEAEKKQRFDRLIKLQNEISAEKHRAYVGRTLRILVDAPGKHGETRLSARTPGGRLVHVFGDPCIIGTYQNCEITEASTWSLNGILK